MKNQPNLRFLLALGNAKVVVLKQEDTLQVYSNLQTKHSEDDLVAERLTEALSLQ